MDARRLLIVAAGVLLGAAAGFIAAAVCILIGAAVFWLWIFGDDPWPSAAENALVAFATLLWLGVTLLGGILAWRMTARRPR